MVDKKFCMSSSLMYRYIYDINYSFETDVQCQQVSPDFERLTVTDWQSLYRCLNHLAEEAPKDGKAALALSGGLTPLFLPD